MLDGCLQDRLEVLKTVEAKNAGNEIAKIDGFQGPAY
jgi:hypothetical protein